ncbi:LANO_0B01332g1_1 [Lachancea nothofagi CBS 11611]|uniref:LANO_0B01332g1_1 n=1 Tax=Lachancea nothofagi CBS 11611 TaxID=1266666 RepID=A0A1G4IV44_9SACH|nr:LANO_0B01332g1_1 [Lachancea nothofagi CBS 11611]
MALHNYIYLKHKSHDPSCHTLIARDHDNRPIPRPLNVVNPSIESVDSDKHKKHPKKECCGKCDGNCGKETKKLADIMW